MMAEVCSFSIPDELGVDLSTLVVQGRIVKIAVLTAMEIRSTMGTDVLSAHLDPHLHFEMELVTAIVTMKTHQTLLIVSSFLPIP